MGRHSTAHYFLEGLVDLGGASYAFYVGLGALILNIVVATAATVLVGLISPDRTSATARS